MRNFIMKVLIKLMEYLKRKDELIHCVFCRKDIKGMKLGKEAVYFYAQNYHKKYELGLIIGDRYTSCIACYEHNK